MSLTAAVVCAAIALPHPADACTCEAGPDLFTDEAGHPADAWLLVRPGPWDDDATEIVLRQEGSDALVELETQTHGELTALIPSAGWVAGETYLVSYRDDTRLGFEVNIVEASGDRGEAVAPVVDGLFILDETESGTTTCTVGMYQAIARVSGLAGDRMLATWIWPSDEEATAEPTSYFWGYSSGCLELRTNTCGMGGLVVQGDREYCTKVAEILEDGTLGPASNTSCGDHQVVATEVNDQGPRQLGGEFCPGAGSTSSDSGGCQQGSGAGGLSLLMVVLLAFRRPTFRRIP